VRSALNWWPRSPVSLDLVNGGVKVRSDLRNRQKLEIVIAGAGDTGDAGKSLTRDLNKHCRFGRQYRSTDGQADGPFDPQR
jgi:hypothetical protein